MATTTGYKTLKKVCKLVEAAADKLLRLVFTSLGLPETRLEREDESRTSCNGTKIYNTIQDPNDSELYYFKKEYFIS